MRRPIWQTILIYLILILWSLVVAFPFYWLITTSLKVPLDVSRVAKYYPSEPTEDRAVMYLWTGPLTDTLKIQRSRQSCFEPTTEWWTQLLGRDWEHTSRHIRNSAIAATGSTILAVMLGSMAGYGLSRFKYRWRVLGWRNDQIAFWIISQRFLPPAVFIVPYTLLYVEFKNITGIKLIDTWHGLILIYTVFNIPFATWIMRDFFNNLPIDLEESARVDGATRWQAFLRIVLPLSAPGLVSVGILAFIFSWNEYLYALMLTNFDAITLPVLIAGQNTSRGVEWWYIAALSTISVMPVMVFGLALQRFVVRGLVAGAVKG
jgi:multiple sugar transport system permease protein